MTTDSGTGVVHQAPAFGEVDYDVLVAEQSRFVDGERPAADLRRRARRQVHRRGARLRGPLGQGCGQRHHARAARARPALSSGTVPARLSVLLAGRRRSADPVSATKLVHSHDAVQGPDAGEQLHRSTGCRNTSATAGSATSWNPMSIGRCRANATGERRCRSGSARKPARRKRSAATTNCWPSRASTGTEVWEAAKAGQPGLAGRSAGPQAVHRRGHVRFAVRRPAHACGVSPK